MSLVQHRTGILIKRLKPVATISVRNFGPKKFTHVDGTYRGQAPTRCGYEAHHHEGGFLPRLKIKEAKIDTMPITIKEDPWAKRVARMGENDFLSILGDEHVDQHEVLTHIPEWLRGYDCRREYSVLMRKRHEFSHWKHSSPLKWQHLQERIRFLYRRINNKYMPPDVERLHRSRHRPI